MLTWEHYENRFKATKSMSALLQERSRRQKDKRGTITGDKVQARPKGNDVVSGSGGDIQSLVESVKRKSKTTGVDDGREGKRRKV